MGWKRVIYGLPAMSLYRAWRSSQLARQFKPHPLGFPFAGADAFFSESWEDAERRVFASEFEHADVFVDVGANQGVYSCWAASRGLKVMAIEPEQSNLRFLLSNIRRNGFNVEVMPVALAETPGVGEVFGDGDTASLLPGWADTRPQFSQLVPLNNLDNLLAGRWLDKRLFIKVDVEGFEMDVLRSAGQTIGRDIPPTWIIETFPQNFTKDSSPNQGFAGVFNTMWKAGYEANSILTGGRIAAADVDQWVKDPTTFVAGEANFLFHRLGSLLP